MRALAEAVSDPPAGPADFEGLPDVGDLPSPWETWLLVGLVRHRARQLWVGEIVRTRLGGDLGTIARLGALGHPDAVPGRGTVPGLPEWECYFHGIGCCVTHKVRGDRIDVNFHGDSAEYFDEWFYIWYLKSLREPEPAERRLLELYPSFEPVRLGIADLLAAGA
ncbi:MAG TPA: hypothetical protein VIL46_00365, partial [Gemmataceae bacterium]